MSIAMRLDARRDGRIEAAMTTPSEALRERLLHAALPLAPERGWGAGLVGAAAAAAGLTPGEIALAAPRGGLDLVDAFADWADGRMLEAVAGFDLPAMKVRARVEQAVWSRFQALEPHRQAVARSLLFMAPPQRAGEAARLGWRTADRIWRALGDRSTDENFYSKRAILAGVHGASLVAWVQDGSEDKDAARAFLARRIDGVMRFETLKRRLRQAPDLVSGALRFAAARRYGGAAAGE